MATKINHCRPPDGEGMPSLVAARPAPLAWRIKTGGDFPTLTTTGEIDVWTMTGAPIVLDGWAGEYTWPGSAYYVAAQGGVDGVSWRVTGADGYDGGAYDTLSLAMAAAGEMWRAAVQQAVDEVNRRLEQRWRVRQELLSLELDGVSALAAAGGIGV